MSTYSGFYKPRTKKELLRALLPTWQGRKTDLREMSYKRLYAIYNRVMRERLGKLYAKES